MNSFIENLNQWGGQFLNFAWPMLWQSSLLMAVVFALDFLIWRKIRASIRYALWLVVLVKLCLPPTLALPTSAAWWLFQAKPAVEAPPTRNMSSLMTHAPPQSDFVPPTVADSCAAATEAGRRRVGVAGGRPVSVGLLLWLVFRWRQVMRKVRRADG